MRQQLIHFGEVRLVTRFFEQLDELFQGGWTAADRSDGGAQNFQDLGGIFSQEAVGMFFDDAECFFVATVLGERFQIREHRLRVAVRRKQFSSKTARFRNPARLQVRL